METTFRRAAADDAPAIARLLLLAWRKAYRGILSDALLENRSEAESEQRIRSGIERKPDFRYHVLETGGEIAGISVVGPSEDKDLADTAEIRVFYVHPDRQRRGLGKTMMNHTLDTIRESGKARVALWVLKDNHPARAFYEAMGFVTDGAEKTMEHLENVRAVRYLYQERP